MSLPNGDPSRRDSNDINPFSKAEIYYGDTSAALRKDARNRTFSQIVDATKSSNVQEVRNQHRRSSLDASGQQPRKFLIPVESTLKELLAQEDSDHNCQITIDDKGPKVLQLGTAPSQGYNRVDVRGTYMLSNLLQELTMAQDYGRKQVILDESRLNENPVDRLARFIRDTFWENLTRCIDGANIAMVAKDPKDWTSDPRPRVYVPHGAPEQYEYYTEIARKHPKIRLDVQWLSPNVTPDYVRDLNVAPGLLAIAMDKVEDKNGETTLKGKPFIVPGGRFNELYGWDSYMASLGLLIHDRVDLCKSMVENFVFCIQHYGKILNANRSYYLGRSQPPFLTDMTLRVYDRIRNEPDAHEFLRLGLLAAMKEYFGIWTADPRLDEETGLSRYRPMGVGVPPETESTHFKHVLDPYAAKHGITFEEFVKGYNAKKINEPDLDVYFLHDRAVRESGHDTSYRLENVAADLATVDLNSCLYKIECDLAKTIRNFLGDELAVPEEFRAPGQASFHTSAMWDRRAKKRRLAMDEYMWDEENGMYFDYNTAKKETTQYESVTCFWAMWSGVATPRQAASMVIKSLPKLEELGGLASGTEKSRGPVGINRPNRQWDFPFGWAPQQILAWQGLERYGYHEEAKRTAYKWIYMCTKAFVDFNGVVVEKYNVTNHKEPHKVAAEYGNQGSDFKGVPREGFGWVNASYIVALDIVDTHMKRALGALTEWETFARVTRDLDVYTYANKEGWGESQPPSGEVTPESEKLDKHPTGLFHEGMPAGHVVHGHGLEHLAHSHGGSARRQAEQEKEMAKEH
ncbi:MAG: alpha,alpha-trehalase nth1 [Alyxoria varia]|nr:MAG: alpha,alpha-trehalase nth1 [Alyxoria varia]